MGVRGYIGQPRSLSGDLYRKPEVLTGTLSGNPDVLSGTLSGQLMRGYSAYDIAVQNGYKGTEEEWLESLKIKGDTGTGIKHIIFNDDYTLSIVMDDETEYTTDPIRGETGKTGTGIASIVFNPDYTLTIILDDDEQTQVTTGSIRGAKGDAYILTPEDKAEIYELLLAEYPAVEEVSF